MNILQRIMARFGLELKRISHHPELANLEHVYSSRTPGVVEALNYLDGYVGNARYYRTYVWVRKGISIIADKIAPLPVIVVNANGETITDHPVAKVLDYVNDSHMTPAYLWTTYVGHMILGGEWFCEGVPDGNGNIVELWPRRPDKVGIRPDADRPDYPIVAEYVYITESREPMRIEPEWVITDKHFNPENEWRGLSPLSSLRVPIEIDQSSQRGSLAFQRRGQRPDYAVITPEGTTPKERAAIEAMVEEKFASAEGRTRPIVLEQGVTDIKTLSFPPKDLEIFKLREMSRDEVAGGLGIPDILMGFGNDSYDTEEKRTGALRALWALTLTPLVNRRDAMLNSHFTKRLPLLKPGERIVTDTSGVPELQKDLAPLLEQGTKLWNMGVPFNTIDEKLRLGIGPVPGGEIGYLGSSYLPVESVGTVEQVKQGIAKGVRGAIDGVKALLEFKEKAARRKRSQIGAKLQRIRIGQQKAMRKELTRFFDDLAKRAMKRLNGKQEKTVRIDPGDLISEADWEVLAEIQTRYVQQIMELSWDTWNGALDSEIAFDLQSPLVLRAVRRAGTRIKDVQDYTIEQLKELLDYGYQSGWSIEQYANGDGERGGIADLIEETYHNRAETIARTELGTAQNLGTIDRYKDANVKSVRVLDGGTDDSDDICNELNGTEQTIAWAEANPLEHPNCTRAFEPVLE